MTRYLTGFLLLASASVTHAASVYNITASAGFMLDDNITRAEYSRDIYDDRAWFVGLTGDTAMPLGERSRLQFSANLETWQYQDSNLGHEILSIQVDYILQPAAGFTAPWYSLYVLYGINASDSEDRNGNFNELGLTLGKRLTDRTSLRAGLALHQENADTENFSTDTTRAYANLDFKFGNNTAYTTLAYSTGDIVATVGRQTTGDPYPASLSGYDHTGDDAFPWLDNPWAYKLDADTWSLRLGYVHALASNQSIDISVMQYSSSAYGGNDYDGMIIDLVYLYRF